MAFEEQIEEEKEQELLEEISEEPQTPAGLDDDILGDDAGDIPGEDSREPLENGKSGSVRVVGVRFRIAGKAYYFDPAELPVRRGSHVIVETARGIEYGTVVCSPMEIDRKKCKAPVRPIIRMATPDDDAREQSNREHEKEAFRTCQSKIRQHRLDMKLIDAEYTFDNSKILFYFTADGRVDFRDLVKDLAGIFHTRIELRQIGVRDETKILGGYGICGRPLCCHTYLSDFIPVSIKMAKEQNLSLNPSKISGVCGRLMCCLKNEEETYEELNRKLPRIGDEVQSSDGLTGEVESVNVLRQRVRILVEVEDEKELHEYAAEDVTILRRRKRGQARPKFKRSEERPDSRRAGAPSAARGSAAGAASDSSGSTEHPQEPGSAAFSGAQQDKAQPGAAGARDKDRRAGREEGRSDERARGRRNRGPRREERDAGAERSADTAQKPEREEGDAPAGSSGGAQGSRRRSRGRRRPPRKPQEPGDNQ